VLPADKVLPNLVRVRGKREPRRPFLTEVGRRAATYGEVNDRADEWAAGFLRLGVAPGTTVAVMVHARIEWFAVWLGLARARLLEASVSTDFHGEMLSYALSKSAAKVLVIQADFLTKVTTEVLATTPIERIVVLDGDAPAHCCPAEIRTESAATFLSGVERREIAEVAVWEPASLILTSGTTGPSKFVITPWGSMYSGALTMGPTELIRDCDISYQPLPVSHLSLRCSVYAMALVGAQVVFRDRFSVREFWADVNAYRCTNATVAPFAKLLLDQPERVDDRHSSLRTVVTLAHQSVAFCARFAVEAYGGYGQTEIGVPIMADFRARPNAVGRVRAGYPDLEARIVDEHDREVAVGEIGELIVRSSEPWSLFQGYYGSSDETVAAWTNGWFHTGDLFSRDADGFLYFNDRRKDAIRRRAQNISSFEVEKIILKHPHVVECAAIAVPAKGEEDEVLVAVMVREGFAFQSLHDFAVAAMPKFMVPRYIRVVESLPRTQAMGRTRKFELRKEGITPETWDARNPSDAADAAPRRARC
jgi:carnitine-CoA ligase